jgi:hypothetical protein
MSHDLRMKVEKLYPDFIEAVQGKTVADLEEKVLGYAKELEQVERAKQKDKEDLTNPNSLGSILYKKNIAEGPYKDAKNAITLKTRYIMSLIEEKGGSIENKNPEDHDEARADDE